jgi:hypothetical protein
VELHKKAGKFRSAEGSPLYLSPKAIGTVEAVVDAHIGEEDLEYWNPPAIRQSHRINPPSPGIPYP